MKIDEAALKAARHAYDNEGKGLVECIETYLAALPSAEPGRDRIAVLNTPRGAIGMSGAGGLINSSYWDELEQAAMTYFGAYPDECARAIIRCNLPRPAEPVEVEGSVEGVGP